MNVKQMVQENNRLRERMTPSNRSYMEDMIIALRESRVDRLRAEELLLDAARQVLQAQDHGREARELFGDKPEEAFKDLIEEAQSRPGRKPANVRLLAPWAALTWLFGIASAAGFFSIWRTGSAGPFGRISLFTLLVVGIGAYVLTGLMFKWLDSAGEQEKPPMGPFNLKAFGLYVLIAVAAVYAGSLLSARLPAIPVPPWVGLCLFIAGLAGQSLIFRRK